jgi:Fic family protein
MIFDPNKPYNDLPDLPRSADIETRAVLKACIEARAQLAKLDSEAAQLPNPSILIGSLTIFEARDSSAIENIVTTDDALFKQVQLDEVAADPATKEALRYRHALFQGFKSLRERPITTRTAVDTCRLIKGTEIDIRKIPGTTLTNRGTGEVIYTPPVGEEIIRQKLANWETFLHEQTDIDPLVCLALQHYQFEAIHPFPDGNGRTGRIINILYLIEQKLLKLPIIYLSREILNSRDTYYRLLIEVTRNGRWDLWIEYMLRIVTASALRSSLKVNEIRMLMLHTEQYIREMQKKLHSRELMDVLFAQPYCRIANLIDADIAKRQSASTYLKALTEIGILEEVKVGRDKLFVHKKLHEILTSDGRQIRTYPTKSVMLGDLLFPPLPPTL